MTRRSAMTARAPRSRRLALRTSTPARSARRKSLTRAPSRPSVYRFSSRTSHTTCAREAAERRRANSGLAPSSPSFAPDSDEGGRLEITDLSVPRRPENPASA
jgi:hypothetical protein